MLSKQSNGNKKEYRTTPERVSNPTNMVTWTDENCINLTMNPTTSLWLMTFNSSRNLVPIPVFICMLFDFVLSSKECGLQHTAEHVGMPPVRKRINLRQLVLTCVSCVSAWLSTWPGAYF